MTTLFSLAATAAPHTAGDAALRATAMRALAAKDMNTLAQLAARLDLPADVAARLSSISHQGVRAAWTGRADVQLAARTGDPLGGEKRAGVLASMLTPASTPTVRAAIARAFTAKPTAALAVAWLGLPAALVPIEVVPTVLDKTRQVHLTNPQSFTRQQWVATLPYASTDPVPGNNAPNFTAYAYFAAPGPDPTRGAELTTFISWHLTRLYDEARRTSIQHHGPVQTAVIALINYTRTGRTAPQAALDALVEVADPTAHGHPRVRQQISTMMDRWVSAGMPGLNGTSAAGNGMAIAAEQETPQPVTFTTLAALDTHDAGSLDAHRRSTVETAATDSTDASLLRRLTDWALSPKDPNGTADVPGQASTPTAPPRRDETTYALLANPSLPADCRERLLDAVATWAPRVLTNLQMASVTHLLDSVTGPARLALYTAGADYHTSYPLTSFTRADLAAIVTALADRLEPGSFHRAPSTPDAGQRALTRILADPTVPDHDVLGPLPWRLLVALAGGAATSSPSDGDYTTAARRARAWLLEQLTATCGDDPTTWTIAQDVLRSDAADRTPAGDKVAAVAAALTAAAATA